MAVAGCVGLSVIRSGFAGDGSFDNLYIGNNAQFGTSSTHGSVTINGVTGSSATPGLTVTGDGGVVFSGTFGAGPIPTSAAGTQFMWYPGKAAVVGGYFDSIYDGNIGSYSFAFGDGPIALGTYAVAFGMESQALGNGSAAFGQYSCAQGNNSFAAGFYSGATGEDSTALGASSAYGMLSLTAIWGYAQADNSTAIGNNVISTSYNSFVIGANNAPSPLSTNGDTQWDPSDELFVVGNGLNGAPSNAFVIYKSGAITMPKRQGDIVMGVYGNGNGD